VVVEMKTWFLSFRRVSSGLERGILTIEHMTIQRMDHVGIVIDDLAAATEFFVALGLELQGEGSVEGRWVDRVVGLEGVRAEIAMVDTPDGSGRLELTKFHTPSDQGGNRHAPANTPGIRHVPGGSMPVPVRRYEKRVGRPSLDRVGA